VISWSWTLNGAVLVYIVQVWVLSFIGMALAAAFHLPCIWAKRGFITTDAYAVTHPFRVHLIAFLFSAARYLSESIVFTIAASAIYVIGLHVAYSTWLLELESFAIFLYALSVAHYGQVTWFHGTSLRLRGHTIAFWESYTGRLAGGAPLIFLSPILPYSDLTAKPDELREAIGAQLDARRRAVAAEYEKTGEQMSEGDEAIGRAAMLEATWAMGVYAKVS
jgi:hypothetical protein